LKTYAKIFPSSSPPFRFIDAVYLLDASAHYGVLLESYKFVILLTDVENYVIAIKSSS
jgi:hypothetical protein